MRTGAALRAGRLLAALALLLLTVGAGCNGEHPTEEKPSVGYLAPDFELPNLGGAPVKLSDYRGNVIVLNFWATWCGPCRAELPTLKGIWEKGQPGLLVIGVDAGETRNDVAAFASLNGLEYPVLLDQAMSVARAYEVQTIPATFVIDRDGVIRHRRRGAIKPGELDLAIKALLP